MQHMKYLLYVKVDVNVEIVMKSFPLKMCLDISLSLLKLRENSRGKLIEQTLMSVALSKTSPRNKKTELFV
jgi:hypothetical protein